MPDRLYCVYNNISSKEFDELKSKLTKLNKRLTPFLLNYRFYYTTRLDHDNDYLVLNFRPPIGDYMGSIAVIFDDLPGKKTFSISGIKTQDENGHRYYKKFRPYSGVTVEDMIENTEDWFRKMVHIYNSIEEQDLTSSVELSKEP